MSEKHHIIEFGGAMIPARKMRRSKRIKRAVHRAVRSLVAMLLSTRAPFGD